MGVGSKGLALAAEVQKCYTAVLDVMLQFRYSRIHVKRQNGPLAGQYAQTLAIPLLHRRSNMSQVLIEVDLNDSEMLMTELSPVLDYTQFIESKRFDGVTVLQILASLNTVTIPLIGKIIIERIRANKNVVVKTKGVTISGLNADDVVKVLTRLSKND